mmetsp:Transcript_107467/g.342564  ORF Transcript_107467/g.342564 Transcript_107467/m.342564 type:complete len:229 (+) Transcript_107467:1130-1816(+)
MAAPRIPLATVVDIEAREEVVRMVDIMLLAIVVSPKILEGCKIQGTTLHEYGRDGCVRDLGRLDDGHDVQRLECAIQSDQGCQVPAPSEEVLHDGRVLSAAPEVIIAWNFPHEFAEHGATHCRHDVEDNDADRWAQPASLNEDVRQSRHTRPNDRVAEQRKTCKVTDGFGTEVISQGFHTGGSAGGSSVFSTNSIQVLMQIAQGTCTIGRGQRGHCKRAEANEKEGLR